jgi:hypothetical protein
MKRCFLPLVALCSWLALSLGCAERHTTARDAGREDGSRWPDYDSCFAAGTRVDTPGGPVPIEAAFVGMPVYAFDVARSQRTVRHVTAVHVHPSAPVGVLSVRGGTVLRVTANHPIYLPSHADYRPAGELGPHDHVLSMHGGEAAMAEVAAFEADAAIDTVYNISVSGEQNYFAEGVLVHNKSYVCTPPEVFCLEDSGVGDGGVDSGSADGGVDALAL